MLIDLLRDAKDFREGHISGSRNIPYSQITKHVEELKTSDRIHRSLSVTWVRLRQCFTTGRSYRCLSFRWRHEQLESTRFTFSKKQIVLPNIFRKENNHG